MTGKTIDSIIPERKTKISNEEQSEELVYEAYNAEPTPKSL